MTKETVVCIKLLVAVGNKNANEVGRYSEEVAARLVRDGQGVEVNRVVEGNVLNQEHPQGAQVQSGDASEEAESAAIKAALEEGDQRTARAIYDSLRSKFPDMDEPNLEKWAKDVGKLRKSGPNHDQIKQAFVFARGNDEWSQRIKTPASLNKNYAAIKIDHDRARAELDEVEE